MGKKSIPEQLMEEARGVTIVVLDTRSHEPVAVTPMPAIQEEPRVSAKSDFTNTAGVCESSLADFPARCPKDRTLGEPCR